MPLQRPILRPGYAVLRRTASSIQIGLHPDHAVRLDLPAATCDAVLTALDGSRTTAEALACAVAAGADPALATAMLDRLAADGLLVDAGTWLSPTAGWSDVERGRRLPDLTAWSRYGDVSVLVARRQAATIGVYGAGRVGSAVALLLAAAGIGRLVLVDDQAVTAADLTPYGFRRSQLGRPRALAVRDLVQELGTRTSVTAAGGGRASRDVAGPADADVVVLCPDAAEPDRDLVAELTRASVPHLPVRVRETAGAVGPFVLPGETSCVRCTDLHRADRDPAWPALLAQLARTVAAPPDAVLAAQLAALASAQVLQWLAHGEVSTTGAGAEVELVGGLTRTRPWPPHPYCGCRWPEQIAEELSLTGEPAAEPA